MKTSMILSGLMFGLSTFLVSAQSQLPPRVSLGVQLNPGPAQGQEAATPSEGTGEEEKPDINEIISTQTVFTNSVGMVMKKVGAMWVSAYETTQNEYQAIMGSNPSAFAGEKHPVDSVSWNDAVSFCAKLTRHEDTEEMLPEGYHYALLTQQLWDSLASGVSLKQAVTSSETSRTGTAPVGSLGASSAGLYDLRGNVAEWCADPSDGAYRVLRGGSWADWIDINLRLDFRIYEAPEVAKNTFGFRCVMTKGK